MHKGVCFFGILVALTLSAQSLRAGSVLDEGLFSRAILRGTIGGLDRVLSLLAASKLLPFRADGGGDGGGSGDGSGTGDGGTGTGGDSSGGDSTGGDSSGGDSTGDDSASNSAADAAAAAAAATSDDAAVAAAATATSNDAATAASVAAAVALDAPAADPANTDPSQTNNNMPDQTDPTVNNPDVVGPTPTTDPNTIALTPELAAIEAIPTTDPRGGFDSVTTTDTGALGPGGTIAPGGLGGGAPPAAPVDVYISAVIVSAAQSPWDAIKRTPGVRNVIVTGGIIALGKTPIPGEIPGGGPEPMWLRVIPDPRLLNGSVIPPVVPNIIDVRIVNCPIKVVENPAN